MWDFVFGTKHCAQFLPLWTEMNCLVPPEMQNSPWLEIPWSAGASALCWCTGGRIHHESSQHSKSTLDEIQRINPCWTQNKAHHHEYFRKWKYRFRKDYLDRQTPASVGPSCPLPSDWIAPETPSGFLTGWKSDWSRSQTHDGHLKDQCERAFSWSQCTEEHMESHLGICHNSDNSSQM